MKKKYLFVILYLTLAIFLSGCSGGGIITPVTDEAKVKSVINEYFIAINNQNWSKAKNCCVYGSDRYYATCIMEQYVNSLSQYGVVTITCVVSISNVSIYGSYAQAYINLTLYFIYGAYYSVDSGSTYYYLQKIGNSWKIYGPGVTYKGVF